MTTEEFKNTIVPYSRKMYPMIRRILKDDEETRDALQDLMIKLWDKRNELEKCSNLNAYIVTVAKNYSFDLLKKKRPVRLNDAEKNIVLNFESVGIQPDVKEKYEHVHKVIETLPEKYKTVIQMRDIDGFGYDEISEFTGLEIPNIRVILSRARLKVKEEVEKIYNYEAGKEKQFAQQIL